MVLFIHILHNNIQDILLYMHLQSHLILSLGGGRAAVILTLEIGTEFFISDMKTGKLRFTGVGDLCKFPLTI